MVVAGTNFALLYAAFVRRRPRSFARDEEFRLYVGLLVVATAILFLELLARGEFGGEAAVRHAAFQTVSMMTTTGFASADFATWSTLALVGLVGLMMIGGSAGSTSGSIKVVRHLVIGKSLRRELDVAVHPELVSAVHFNHRPVDERTVRSVIAFVLLYVGLFALGALLITIDAAVQGAVVTPFEAIAAVATTLGNVGPGLGFAGPFGSFADFSGFSKVVMIVLMWLGRLEIIPVLVLLHAAVLARMTLDAARRHRRAARRARPRRQPLRSLRDPRLPARRPAARAERAALTTVVQPSEVTKFVAELGVIFLLFFLGLEFTFERLLRAGRHVTLGGTIDLVANMGLGLIVGLAAFGVSFGALIVAAAVYVSSSAVAVKALTDFRRLADDETDLVLAILLFEDLVIALVLGFAAGGGGSAAGTVGAARKAILFVGGSLAVSRYAVRWIDRLLDWLPREFFLLFVVALLAGMSAASHALGLSEAIGALMAGVILSETSVREEIEERFFSFRDVFAALFFFVFGLTIDVGALGSVGWLVALAVVLSRDREDGRRLRGRPAGRVHVAAEHQRRRRARRARGVHDHPRADRRRQRGALRRRPARHLRVRRALCPGDRDDRRRADEGVAAHRPRSCFLPVSDMTTELRETRLPGVGVKYTLMCRHGQRLAVILHNDGTREVYVFDRPTAEEPAAVIQLEDEEARQLGAILGGAYERPKIVEELEMAIGELAIEWIPVPPAAQRSGKRSPTAAFRQRTGITIIAILREPEPVAGAQPDDVIQEGDTLVTVGKLGQYREFRRLLAEGPFPGRPGRLGHVRCPTLGLTLSADSDGQSPCCGTSAQTCLKQAIEVFPRGHRQRDAFDRPQGVCRPLSTRHAGSPGR